MITYLASYVYILFLKKLNSVFPRFTMLEFLDINCIVPIACSFFRFFFSFVIIDCYYFLSCDANPITFSG